MGGQDFLVASLLITIGPLPACPVLCEREWDSECLGLQEPGSRLGRGRWGLVAGWKKKGAWQAEAWIPQLSPGNVSDIFQPQVSGQAGIYGSAVSHDDLGGAELCVTPD